MSTRRNPSRSFLPMTEGLETRKLLSTKTISGQDSDGDTWVLRLQGPGDLRITKQVDAQGNDQTLDSASQIDTITIAGADPLSTRLIGQVKRGPNGDGKVFFNNIDELGGRAEGPAATNGIYAIDMPDFWLGNTATAATPTAEPTISIPDGVITLRFGGADTTFTPPGGTDLNTNNQSDTFNVNLGIPRTQGTTVIVNQVVTSGQAGAASSTGTPGTPTQDSVVFNVAGRLNQFQANSILGNTAFPTTGFRGGGGTLVVSQTDTATGVTGQIGFARVGGNATNFSVQTNDKISNYYVGGEANNVQILAPAGSRAIEFGKGMDTATILTHYIDSLQANRGAVNSNVTVDRNVGRVTFGGDVVDTNFTAGVQQGLAAVFSNQTAPTTAPTAQDGGAITNVLIAGNVMNSVFAASTEPLNGTYGTSDLLLPHGHIEAKVGGTIDNSTATPDSPNTAFFSKYVKLDQGPVIPPSVPELPFGNQGAPPSGNRIVPGLQPTENLRNNLFKTQAGKAIGTVTSSGNQLKFHGPSIAAKSVSTTAKAPHGPLKKKA
jgi:hypothetical protein